jgi:hypothetical protein
VQTPVDEQLRREASRYSLRYACQNCAHFAPETGTCAEGYPNHDHVAAPLETTRTLIFCKSFELW